MPTFWAAAAQIVDKESAMKLAAIREPRLGSYTVTGVNRAAPGTGVRRLVEKSVVVKSTTYVTGSPIVR
jgi:hypothetical protein